MIEVPLNSSPEQLFSIVISGETFDCRIVLNSRSEVWSISLSQSGVELLNGIALVGGIDIFNQHNIPIENVYVVNLGNSNLDPSKTNLGVIAKLFILTDEEVGND